VKEEEKMTISEELWFLVAIGGFLTFLQGALTGIISTIIKKIFNKNVSNETILGVVGFIIFLIALVSLFTLPANLKSPPHTP
jgi:hypothetical protein